ncbi:MAG: S8 family peptidase [Bacteroidetes bacterium]|nr:S8 family peptidase [Bacteroidota bacterium]
MRKILFSIFSVYVLSVATAFAQPTNVQPGDLIVLLKAGVEPGQLCDDLSSINGVSTNLKVVEPLSKSMNIYLLHFNEQAIDQSKMLSIVRQHAFVSIAQFNHTFTERLTPNDPQFGVMWDMNNTGQSGGTPDADIDAVEAWDITTGGLTTQGDTIVVAVVDGGFDLNQQDLNFWKNRDEIPNNSIDDDNNGYVDDYDGWYTQNNTDNVPSQSHGTHVSGTVGAKGNNGIGVTGVNWNVKVMPLAYGNTGGLESNVVEAYGYARDQRREYNQTNGTKGAFVVSTNSSFGVDLADPADYPLWCAMYDSLGAVGILSAGATANANYNVDAQGDIPTACTSDWLITVTNTNRNDVKATAGYGATTIDLGAPGSSITSTYPSNAYQSISGTSMATPHVAGTVALMLSVACPDFITNYKANPSAMALVLKDSLLNAADPIAALSGITVTGARLNLFNAVKAIQNYCLTGIDEAAIAEASFAVLNAAYPNPANDKLTIAYNSLTEVEVVMTNILGQEVKRIKGDTSTKGVQHSVIDLTSVAKGVYFITIDNGKAVSNVLKVVVSH